MDSLNKSFGQFVLMLVALACMFIIILGIQNSAYIINSILLAAIIALGIIPLPRRLIQRGMNSEAGLDPDSRDDCRYIGRSGYAGCYFFTKFIS